LPVDLALSRETTFDSFELQQILESGMHSLIVGGRYQSGEVESSDTIKSLDNSFSGTRTDSAESDLWRASAYAYYQVRPWEPLKLTGGVSYDKLHYPFNVDLAPVTSGEREKEKFSPKAGFDLMLCPRTRLRAAYTRSLGGYVNDANTRIEPSQVAGFNQSFRSIIPESFAGSLLAGSEFETWNIGLDHTFKTHTYVDVEGEFLNSRGDTFEGDYTNKFVIQIPNAKSSTRHTFDFREKTLFVNVNHVFCEEWSLGARYRLSQADFDGRFTGIPTGLATTAKVNQDQTSSLHQLQFYANYNLPCGFFSQFQSIWSKQTNRGFTPAEPGDSFWHLNFFAGYRFPNRHAEIRLGVLNLTDRDYGLEPMNFFQEMPHRRTLAATFKFTF
jgi:outer membrane receptor protein involved in Fe transport